MGFLRLLTNRSVMGGDSLNPKAAWEIYDALRADPQVVFLEEVPEVTVRWREISTGAIGGPNMWTDAYLSALASARNVQLVTFDRRLGRQAGANVLEP